MIHIPNMTGNFSELAINLIKGAKEASAQDQGGAKMADESKTSRRADSSLSTTLPSVFHIPSLCNLSRMVTIFSLVTGDFY